MDAAVFVIGLVAAVVAVLTLWVNLGQYQLQRTWVLSSPGEKIDPDDAEVALGEIEEDPVRRIASNHIFVESGKKSVGYIDRKPIGVYLDLHTAACDPRQRLILARSLASFIAERIGPWSPDICIASPREGNLLLGAAVAEQLNARFLIIRTGRAPRFGYPIEGTFYPGSSVVLVDDLCMEGVFLRRCAYLLRRYGLNVAHCVCLFERMDGDAREVLATISVTLHSRYEIDDSSLTELSGKGIEPRRAEDA